MEDSVEELVGRIKEYCEDAEVDSDPLLSRECHSLEGYNDNPMSYLYSDYWGEEEGEDQAHVCAGYK